MSTGKICCLVMLTLGVLAAVVVLVVILTQPKCGPQRYLHGAVAADTETCSVIGRDILKSGGTAVDAAIAGLICTSVMNPQSSGLGGGVVFSIYNASTGTVEVINARETVPRVFPQDLLSDCAHIPIGSRWIAVPGELRGYEEAHKRHGRLPWKALFEPTIKLLSDPLVISPVMDKIIHHPDFASLGSRLCPLICDGERFLKRGETFRWPALQQTLQAVAEKGATAFYEGQLGRALVEDIRKAGSTISLEDLQEYKAEVSPALNITLNNHTTLFSPGPPMGGAVLMFILKILEEYKFHEASLATPEEKVETYHRIAEALKFGNMLKPNMSDPAFSEAQETVGTILSDKIAELVRHRIDRRGDHPLNHYNLLESIYNHRYESKGTSHISVLAADGSAVSATSTINYPFGSFVYSKRTGIILNNELADFCMAKKSIKSGEKPPSAMVPSILISKTGDMLVIGGAGGAQIISATSMAIINKLWFGYDLERAISAPIMHTDGDNILFEEHFSEEVRSGLLRRGHKEKEFKFAMNVVQGISKEGKCISAYSDKRKLGKSAGY
ncbi:glutathione hydrolase 5 proenzyme isoform X1 [Falco peregrinus]|uniref:glutathione hydrolase 5 proenzyme isoform X1 n=1 Tax=Falco peregrinus TaxID=8954 RepID=UPI000387213C|nr:glutathione hydrolase 5 proenzyme isoform X1 [Falco peregrinus]XP_027636712.1 glutathione hydrolase 5 proenzyme isoform X1 [Falco peregrinus]XP_027636713.1 glutathione hydrolase 5 proenzyme isoform X1 [Falco peregrinus]